MINSNGKLDCFESFRIDRRLPKYSIRMEEMSDNSDNSYSDNPYSVFKSNNSFIRVENSGSLVILPKPKTPGFLARILAWFKSNKEEEPTLSIPMFFSLVKGAVSEIGDMKVVEERAKGYESALLQAKTTGQQALFEKLSKNLVVTRAEAHLFELELKKFISEETLIKFVKKCPKGLRLDWIENFTRMIPKEVVSVKQKCDLRLIFDNYLILHYDPTEKSYEETHAQKEAKKDPILFGVIDGRRTLYYIGDWVDEICDLTLDQIADLLGKEAINQIA